MNKILYLKVKRDLKIKDEDKIKSVVNKLQGKFDLKDNANIFDIEQKINDKEYSEFIRDNS